MAGLDPATQPASVCERNESLSAADAGALGGRLKGGHGERYRMKEADGTASTVGTGSSRAYSCRWAPCSQDHDPGQGQLPVRKLRPLGIAILTRGAAHVL